jgi:NitT/TauT family transport system permease protein
MSDLAVTTQVPPPATQASGMRERTRKAVVTGRLDYSPRQKLLITVLSVLTFFVLWTAAKQAFDIPRLFLPGLDEIYQALASSHRAGRLVPNALVSVNLFVWSMALSLAIAVPLGIVIGAVDTLNRTFSTWLWAIYTAPQIVFLPLVLLWAGITTTAKVILIVISAVPPAAVIILEGVKTVDASLIKASRTFGADRRQMLWKVVIPATMPYIGTGVRMGVSRGLVGLFAAELFTAQAGLGFLLMDASRRYNTPMVFGVLALYLVFCMTAIAGSNSLEKRLGRWRD